MTNRKDGGAAFPQPCTSNGYQANSPFEVAGGGMTLRDYFAAKVASGDAAADEGWSISATGSQLAARAELYYRLADAMLKSREE